MTTNTERARANAILSRLWRVAHGKLSWEAIPLKPHNIEQEYAGDRVAPSVSRPLVLRAGVSANARTGVKRHAIWLFRHDYLRVLAQATDNQSDALTDHLTKSRYSAIFVQRRDKYEPNQNNREGRPLTEIATAIQAACMVTSHATWDTPPHLDERHKVIVAELLEHDRALTGQRLRDQLFYSSDHELRVLLRALADTGLVPSPREEMGEQEFRLLDDRVQVILWALSDLPWHECMALDDKAAHMRRLESLRYN